MGTKPSNTNTAKVLQICFAIGFLFAFSHVINFNNKTVADMERECGPSYYPGFTACESSQSSGYYVYLCAIPLSLVSFGLLAFGRTGFFAKSPLPEREPAVIAGPENQERAAFVPIVPTAPINTVSPTISPKATTIEDELQKAADMLAKGLIDEEEYKQLKQKIISKA